VSGRRVAWGIWGLTLALLVVWPFLGAAAGQLDDEWGLYVAVPIGVLAYATVGALITSRHPENRIGLILGGVGLAFAVALTAADYATLSVRRPEPLPLVAWVGWLGRVAFALWLAPLPLLFLLYPNGHLATRRWRPVLWVLVAALCVNVSLFALTPGPLTTGFGETGVGISNPIGLPLVWLGVVEDLTELAGLVALGCAGLAGVSLVLRFRRSEGLERQQIRWLGYVGAILVALPLVALLIALGRSLLGIHVSEENDYLSIAAWIAFFAVLVFGVPIACAIAILRYHLYELDVVVKKTVQYGVLFVASLALIGLLVLTPGILFVGIDRRIVPGIVIGVVLAAVLWMLRVPAQHIANRVVYGSRATPYEVLSEFAERVGETYSTQDVLPRMAQLLGEATGARVARVWLMVGGSMRAEASWPADASRPPDAPVAGDALPPFEGASFEVRHQGELLGALTVTPAPDDPMTPTKAKLARDMAAQAGLVLRNVRLIEDLRESRRRIVAAQDARAKKLERDIHDGAQQQLVAIAVKQRIAGALVGKDDTRLRALLEELQSATNEALEDLRDLARGIYPPLLADRGLAAALEGQARKATIPVELHTYGIGRYAPDTESAVYFSCLEALQNVTKYADASVATVRLMQANGTLTFEVTDDGRGFDPATVDRGTGLQGIADRLAALGGDFTVRSTPGAGTTVIGAVPADASEATG
jgi:signal transduction histidine kinase